MSTPTQIRQRISDLQKLIAGVQETYARPPKSIIGANMPLFVNVWGESENDKDFWGTQDAREGRLIRMLLYVTPMSGGVPGEAEESLEPWFDTVRLFWNQHPSLRDAALTDNSELTDIEGAYLEGDNGVVGLAYSEDPTKYAGIEFRLRVWRRSHFVFAAYN